MTGTFPDDVVAAVCRHMNGDHAGDNVLICRAFGGQPEATAATLVGLDGAGMDFVATVHDAEVPARVPFRAPVVERAQIRTEVVRLYHEACQRLGVAPRPATSHPGASG